MRVTPVTRVAAVTVAAIIAVSCIAIVPTSSSAESDTSDYQYGNTFGMDLDAVNKFVFELTGKTLTEYVEFYLSEKIPSIDTTVNPLAKADFALTRGTEQDGSGLEVTDRLSGSFQLILNVNANGSFPEPGTYEAEEGESALHLIERVFSGATAAPSEKRVYVSFMAYIEMVATSHYDTDSGELESTDINLRLMVIDDEQHDIFVTPVEDEDGKVTAIIVDQDDVSTHNNIYLNLVLKLTMDGMVLSSDKDSWHIDPLVNFSIKKAAVSADLADSVGKYLMESLQDNGGSFKLPELIIKLLKNGGRNIDLVQTMESLTNSGLSDMSFLLHFDAAPYTDSHSYKYTKLTQSGSTNYLTLSKGAYVLDFNDLVWFIPDEILSPDEKLALIAALTLAHWNEIDVKDLSGDPAKRADCDRTIRYVDSVIQTDEQEDYTIPTGYKVGAGVAIAFSILIPLVLLGRRFI